MKMARKRSNIRNKGRRVSYFKAGHPSLFRRSSAQVTSSGSNTINEQNVLTTASRIKSFELPDVLSVASRECEEPGVLAYRLRPEKGDSYSQCLDNNDVTCDKKSTCEYSENENIIVNVKQLEKLFCAFAPHSCEASESDSVSIHIVERQGLCVSVVAKCNKCGFNTPKTGLFTKMKAQRGPDAGCINTMMLMPVLKSRVGINDLNMTLACLNIRSPDKRGLQRKLNTVTDKVEDMNKEQMIQNQQYVRRIQTLAGLPNESDVEFDVSYTSRPQQGCERATQCFAPVIEQTTTRHLPISIKTANKLCTKQTCNHNTNSCKRNYNPTESIQSAEPKLLKSNLQDIAEQNNLRVRSVTSDASAQIAKAMREVRASGNPTARHYKCFIHRMRSFSKQVKNLRLASIPKEYDRGVYTQKLACCLRARIRLELTRYRKRFIRDDQYVSHAKLCVENIMQCIQGKHVQCREKSMVCEAHMASYSTKSLPYGKHITLSSVDIDKVSAVISKYVSPDCLREMARLSTTNQCESIHSQLFRCVPKHTGWSRNFTGLCHSVTHSASLGSGASMLKTAQLLGLPVSKSDPFHQFITKLDAESRYHGRRQASFKYKSLRHVRRRQKNNRKLLHLSAYGTDRQIDVEHDYGLNPVD
ncbi:MAG: hypothetical protein AB2693_06255 [Candidatus Thiodiazotropha sp.]